MKQTVEEAATYTEGICGNGAAILKDGVMMTIPEVLKELNKAAASLPTNSMHTQPEEREERVRIAGDAWEASEKYGEALYNFNEHGVLVIVADKEQYLSTIK